MSNKDNLGHTDVEMSGQHSASGVVEADVPGPNSGPDRPVVPSKMIKMKSVNKVIVPEEADYCRVAFYKPGQLGVPGAIMLCKCSKKTYPGPKHPPQSPTEHITRRTAGNPGYHYTRGDDLSLATKDDIDSAAEQGILEEDCIMMRDDDKILDHRKDGEQVNAQPVGVLPVPGPLQVPGVPAGAIIRRAYERNGIAYVEHADGIWYNHGPST